MHPDIPLIDDIYDLTPYLSPDMIYVDYYPKTERTGDLPIASFAYIGWDGRPKTMPSVKLPVRFQYKVGSIFYDGTIDPVKRRFDASEVRNQGLSTEYVYSTQRGPYIEIENPQLGRLNISLYEKPSAPVIGNPPLPRTFQVYDHGIGSIFPPLNFLIIVVMLVLVLAMLSRSEFPSGMYTKSNIRSNTTTPAIRIP